MFIAPAGRAAMMVVAVVDGVVSAATAVAE